MEYIDITEVVASRRRLNIKFTCSNPDLASYFKTTDFQTDYSLPIDTVPPSILVIPLLVQLLPLSWILNFEIRVKEIDKDFFESIPKFKEGYINMYPVFEFRGKLSVDTIIDNDRDTLNNRGTLYSGGVDACATLIAHADENPDLIIIQGSDIHLDQMRAWEAVRKKNDEIADLFGVDSLWISSNYCEMLEYAKFNKISYRAGDNWWHGMQHGIGILGLCAPIAYVRGYITLFIASSHTENDHVNCASDPIIDNHVAFCGCRVIHDQYEFNRIQKTKHIVDYSQKKLVYPFLRVCYFSGNETNCCRCEKCLRTAIALSLMGEDITKYGFINPDIMFKGSKWRIISSVNYSAIPLWKDIQEYANSNDSKFIHPMIRWVQTTNWERETVSLKTRGRRFIERKIKTLFR